MDQNNSKSYGALFGSIIVILIIVLGGVYFLLSKEKASDEIMENTEQTGSTVLQDSENADTMDTIDQLEQESTNVDVSIDVDSVQ